MEYIEKYLKSIYWIFGVWDEYMNDRINFYIYK